MTWEFSNFVFKTDEISFKFVCKNHALFHLKNHAFQSTLLFHLTTFLSAG